MSGKKSIGFICQIKETDSDTLFFHLLAQITRAFGPKQNRGSECTLLGNLGRGLVLPHATAEIGGSWAKGDFLIAARSPVLGPLKGSMKAAGPQ